MFTLLSNAVSCYLNYHCNTKSFVRPYVEQFAMGLNMPAKTVVFTAVKKFDGDSHRYIGSGEYIQVSGGFSAQFVTYLDICLAFSYL